MSKLEDTNGAVLADNNQLEEPTMDPELLEEMIKAGVLYGRRKSKTHPRVKPFIFTTRNGIEIFDLPRTIKLIEKAEEMLKATVKKGNVVLVVGTHPASKDLVKSFGEKFGFPYVIQRWLGGTLTNFSTISRRLKYYMNLKADRETGKLEKYTKKERTGFDKEINRLSMFFSGLERLNNLPSVVLIVDGGDHGIVVREAQKLNIPVIAINNSDVNPEIVDYPIIGNTQSKSSVAWILNRLQSAVEEGLRERAIAKEAKPTAEGENKVNPTSSEVVGDAGDK